MNIIDNVTILVSTCDSFSDLWQNNKILFERFWPNHPNIIYFSDKNTSIPNFDICVFNNDEFSFRLKKVLSMVKTKYVLLTLDDYLLDKYVNKGSFGYCLEYLEKNDGDYFRFYKRTKVKGIFLDSQYKIKKLPLIKTAYEVNLYPSIWKTESLKRMIKKEENIWKFEVRMTRRSKELGFSGYTTYDDRIFHFVDTIRKGKYIRKAYNFLNRNNLYISDRKIQSWYEKIKLDFRTFLSRILPNKIKKLFKRISKKQFFSNFAENDD